MKLICLNIWGGKLTDPLLNLIKEYKEIDIFCFQEVYSSSSNKKINREMLANIFEEIAKVLKDYNGYFATHLKQYSLDGKVNFELSSGLGLFIRKSIKVKEYNDFFIYRSGFGLLNEDYKTIPRNLQYLTFSNNGKDYLIGHFHGIWYPKTKMDTPQRIKQAQKIKQFLSTRTESIILCGDFNLLPGTKSMHILEKGMKNLIKDFNVLTTRNEYYQGIEKHADYILVSPDVNVIEFKVISKIVSDHLPLFLEFS